jgi:hypothetical protein
MIRHPMPSEHLERHNNRIRVDLPSANISPKHLHSTLIPRTSPQFITPTMELDIPHRPLMIPNRLVGAIAQLQIKPRNPLIV